MAEAPGSITLPPEPLPTPLESRFASVVTSLPLRLDISKVSPLQDAVATATNQLALNIHHRLIQEHPLEPISDPLKAKRLSPEAILENDQGHREMEDIAKQVQNDPKLWQTVDRRIEGLRSLMVEFYKAGNPGTQIILDDRPLIALLMALEPKNRDAFYYDLYGNGLKNIMLESRVARTVCESFPTLFQDSEGVTVERTTK